ncbi:MAG: tetratricopeptide repeat protein, partial [bacterium]
HCALGDTYHALGFHEQAAEEFVRAGLDPQTELRLLNAEQLLDSAQVQFYLGNHQNSLQLYQRALEGHPDPPAYVYFNLAYLHTLLGDTLQAEENLSTAERIDPREARVPHLWGLICENRGEWEQALGHFRYALERKPSFHVARAHAALMCLRLGDKQEAGKLIEPLVGKIITEPELSELVTEIARQVGY